MTKRYPAYQLAGVIVAVLAWRPAGAAVPARPTARPIAPAVALPLDGGKVTVNLATPFSPLRLHFGGQNLRLIKGLGPVIRINGRTCAPGQYRLELFRSSIDRPARRVYAVYRILGLPRPTYYWMAFATQGPFLKISLELREPIAPRVQAGQLVAPAGFKPFTVTTRAREAWQDFMTQAGFWNRAGHFWVYAHWNWRKSNSVDGAQLGFDNKYWRRVADANTLGEGDRLLTHSDLDRWRCCIAPAAQYPPFAFGLRRAVHEQLIIGVSGDLWKAVGPLSNQPSRYGPALAKSMFVDLWNNHYHANAKFLKRLGRQVAGTIRFYTIVQTWQWGGFDYADPDMYWPPRYPACTKKGYGSLQDLKKLLATGKRFGWVGLRNNYWLIGFNANASPSYRAGLIRMGMKQPAPPGWPPANHALASLRYRPGQRWSSFRDWASLARLQETDIAKAFHPDAVFTDELGGGLQVYPEGGYSVDAPWVIGAGVGRRLIHAQMRIARLLGRIHHGPVSSESTDNEPLLGRWVATGDYGIFDGADRLITPAYKLHELQRLSAFAGMGLGYRFFNYPGPNWGAYGNRRFFRGTPGDRLSGIDAYNAMTVLWGNGAYYFAGAKQSWDMRWDVPFVDAMTIGVLQRYYDLVPVKRILYRWHDRWQTLNDLMQDSDINFEPVQDNCPAFKVIRVEYTNGLVVTVNRGQAPFGVHAGGTALTLPQNGWVGAMPNGSVLVYSAISPLAKKRIDFSFDKRRGIRFINPRGQSAAGVTKATLWLHGTKR